MKKKILFTLLLCVPFISIILVILFRLTATPSNEEIIERLRDTPCYTANVEYVFKNTRGEEKEETVQYFNKEKGAKIEFGQDRVKLYKDDGILIKDSISNKEYTMEKDMDKMHSIAFLENLLGNPILEGTLIEGQEEWGETQYIEFMTEIFLENEHLDKAKVYIDKENKAPIGAIIYDKQGNDRVKILYKDFKKMKSDEMIIE